MFTTPPLPPAAAAAACGAASAACCLSGRPRGRSQSAVPPTNKNAISGKGDHRERKKKGRLRTNQSGPRRNSRCGGGLLLIKAAASAPEASCEHRTNQPRKVNERFKLGFRRCSCSCVAVSARSEGEEGSRGGQRRRGWTELRIGRRKQSRLRLRTGGKRLGADGIWGRQQQDQAGS